MTLPVVPARILIVEDTPTNIQTLSAILKQEGYLISVAINGRQAVDVIDKVKPDLVLMDVMMPEMDGYEACRIIKSRAEWKDLPIIFLTAKTEVADIVRGFELGAVDYVGKPFNAHELLARVNTHLTIARLHKENTRLLLNILPGPIAEQLKRRDGIIAERFEDVSVLFADIVGFTPRSAAMSPSEIVGLLNLIFSRFDALVEKHGLEKIKTIGDAYMVAGGLPDPQPGHLERIVALALDMQAAAVELSPQTGELQLRIGIHTGSAVAGVIGIKKFIYDVWGDTVNTASRIESHGLPGRVQVSEEVYERIRDSFVCTPRGPVELKGKGAVPVFLVERELLSV